MISREKASRGFCALSVVRESGAAFFFYFLLFFFFWFRLTRGQGDLIETVGGGLAEFEREREREKRKLEPKCVSICKGRNETTLVYYRFISK